MPLTSESPDFYRELGHLFGVPLAPHNRWAGFKSLRETWTAQVEATRCRPVLIIDEAQEILPNVLAELRILASTNFDSRSLLTVVLAGDGRLTRQFRRDDLLPVASRIRVRLTLGYLHPPQLIHAMSGRSSIGTERHPAPAAGCGRPIDASPKISIAEGSRSRSYKQRSC